MRLDTPLPRNTHRVVVVLCVLLLGSCASELDPVDTPPGAELAARWPNALGPDLGLRSPLPGSPMARPWDVFDGVVLPAADVPAGSLFINEVHNNPSGGDDDDVNEDGNADEREDEFVEIVNTTSMAVDLSGIILRDSGGGARHVFPVGSIVPPGDAMVVFDEGTPPTTFEFGNASVGASTVQVSSTANLALDNDNDNVRLFQSDNTTLVAGFMYSGPSGMSDGNSWNRDPEMAIGTIVRHRTLSPSFGRAISAASPPRGDRSPGRRFNGRAFVRGITGFAGTTCLTTGATATLTVDGNGFERVSPAPGVAVPPLPEITAVEIFRGVTVLATVGPSGLARPNRRQIVVQVPAGLTPGPAGVRIVDRFPVFADSTATALTSSADSIQSSETLTLAPSCTPDAGPADMGPADTGPADMGPTDMGPVDTGPADSGGADTGPVDSGRVDMGPVDSGPVDMGPVDSGRLDMGPVADSGPLDMGSVADSGPVDMGPVADSGPVDMGGADTGPADAGADLGIVGDAGRDGGPPVRDAGRDTGSGTACTAPEIECDGRCVDTSSNISHCGGCDRLCDPGFICAAGECTVSTDEDAGSGARDAGRPTADGSMPRTDGGSGGTPSDEGGCCSVAGSSRRDRDTRGLLALVLAGALVLWRRRRRA